MTPAQLRREAKARGVDSRGTKAQLLERLSIPDTTSKKASPDATAETAVSAAKSNQPRTDTLPEVRSESSASPNPTPAPGSKEPWQMMRDEYLSQTSRDALAEVSPTNQDARRYWAEEVVDPTGHTIHHTAHKQAVRDALSEGKPVPPEVLADYPDLAKSATAKPAPEPKNADSRLSRRNSATTETDAKAAPDPSPAASPGKRAVSGSEGGGEKAKPTTADRVVSKLDNKRVTIANATSNPFVGEVYSAEKSRDALWGQVKKLREKVKELGPQAGQSRLDLLKAESAHRDAVARVKAAREQVEKRANEIGETTVSDKSVNKPPMNARRGAVINPFFPEPPREPAHKISDPDIDARWREAKQGVGKASVRDIVAGALNTVVKGTMRGSLPELPRTEQFGEARSAARAMRDAKAIGQDAAERAIAPIIKDMSPDEYDLFSQRVVFADLAKTDGKLPFGLRDKDQAKAELDRIDAAVAKSPKVQAALKRRAETMQGIKDEYTKAFAPLGVDMSKRLNREDYYRHQVLMYAQERARQAVGVGPGKPVTTPTNRGFLKGREGSSLDINANYVQAEFEVMAQMVADTKMANAIERIRKTYDIRPELVEKAKEEGKEVSDIIPDTHTEYAIRPGKTMFSVYTVPEKYAAEALLNGATELSVPIEKVRTALAVGSDFTPLIVPKEVAAQLEALSPDTKTPNFFTKAWQGSLGAWKQYQLHSPQRVIKYSLRNLTEVDKVMSMAPGSILRVPEAVRDLVKLYRRAEDTPQSIRDWAERSGSSLVRVNEIGDVPAMERFAKVLEDKTGTTPAGQAAKLPLKAWSGYWKAAGIANDMRESILRYASYLHFVDQMKASKDGLPSGFAASNKNEIRGIKDIRDRAYRLSADMLGDYGDISPAGDFLRKNIYPFWSFQEVNFRAYMKGVQNLANDTVTAMRAGRSFATAAGVGRIGAMSAIQIGKLALLLGGFRAITQTINRLMFPDEEKKLPPELRRQSHIILGTDSDGKIRYFNRLGTSGDFLEWFGADAADEDLRDLLNGRRTLGQIASDYAKSPINKLVQGVGPHVKIPMELAYGKSLYPDFTKPRALNPTNDKAEYLASQLGLDTAYKWAAGMPLPKDAAQKAVSSSFLYRLDPDQAAYYRIRDEVARFKSSKGMSRSSEGAEGERANALRNLKLSLRYKDEDAAARFLAQYAALGGSSDGLKSSLMAMNPLSGLSEAQRGEFQSKWLRAEDKPFLDAANKYYKDVLIGDPSAMSRAVQKAQPLIAAEAKKREAQK